MTTASQNMTTTIKYRIVPNTYPNVSLMALEGHASTEDEAKKVAALWDTDDDLGRYGPHRILCVISTELEILR